MKKMMVVILFLVCISFADKLSANGVVNLKYTSASKYVGWLNGKVLADKPVSFADLNVRSHGIYVDLWGAIDNSWAKQTPIESDLSLGWIGQYHPFELDINTYLKGFLFDGAKSPFMVYHLDLAKEIKFAKNLRSICPFVEFDRINSLPSSVAGWRYDDLWSSGFNFFNSFQGEYENEHGTFAVVYDNGGLYPPGLFLKGPLAIDFSVCNWLVFVPKVDAYIPWTSNRVTEVVPSIGIVFTEGWVNDKK